MDKYSDKIFYRILPAIYLLIAFVYILFVIKPAWYYHHVQAPFLFSTGFYSPYLKYPGGIAELLGTFFMQFFYPLYAGPVVLFVFVSAIAWLSYKLLDNIRQKKDNIILAMIPMIFSLVLINNYNFPFSIIVSFIIALLLSLLLSKINKNIFFFFGIFSLSSLLIYYISGSGFLFLFSCLALLTAMKKYKKSSIVFMIIFITAINYVLPLFASKYIFPVSTQKIYFLFIQPDVYFKAYHPTLVFYLFLLNLPVLLLLRNFIPNAPESLKISNTVLSRRIQISALWIMVLIIGYLGHQTSFVSDAKKIAASNFHSYNGHLKKTTRAATSLKDYSFEANLYYNLALVKSDSLSQKFFHFFQIRGTEILYPDIDFRSELSFITSDYYYELGYIPEARHWAYEALVNYPHSPRAIKSLLKIHLVTGEYKAAERCYNILKKGLFNKKFLKEYHAFIVDTSLVKNMHELADKRASIPEERELTPRVYERFTELLIRNPKNKTAFEHLMLYYLLDGNLESLVELYPESGTYFSGPVAIYEEALLLYGEMNQIDISSEFEISHETLSKYEEFNKYLKEFEGNKTMARNALYWKMGKSYLYYYKYVYPRIVKREIIFEEDEEPQI